MYWRSSCAPSCESAPTELPVQDEPTDTPLSSTLRVQMQTTTAGRSWLRGELTTTPTGRTLRSDQAAAAYASHLNATGRPAAQPESCAHGPAALSAPVGATTAETLVSAGVSSGAGQRFNGRRIPGPAPPHAARRHGHAAPHQLEEASISPLSITPEAAWRRPPSAAPPCGSIDRRSIACQEISLARSPMVPRNDIADGAVLTASESSDARGYNPRRGRTLTPRSR